MTSATLAVHFLVLVKWVVCVCLMSLLISSYTEVWLLLRVYCCCFQCNSSFSDAHIFVALPFSMAKLGLTVAAFIISMLWWKCFSFVCVNGERSKDPVQVKGLQCVSVVLLHICPCLYRKIKRLLVPWIKDAYLHRSFWSTAFSLSYLKMASTYSMVFYYLNLKILAPLFWGWSCFTKSEEDLHEL